MKKIIAAATIAGVILSLGVVGKRRGEVKWRPDGPKKKRPAAKPRASRGDYQMFVTSGSAGGPYAYLLNTRMGTLKF
jgi:hypothetical protein